MRLGSTRARRRAVQAKGRTGFTLVEVCVSLTLCTIAVLGLSAAMKAGSDLQIRTEEYARASRAIAEVHERLHSGSIDEQFNSLLAEPVYEVGTLTVSVGFPEQALTDALGVPPSPASRFRDIDGDGQVDLDPASMTLASLVPVSVDVTWSRGRMQSRFLVTEK